jgi:hypothetical protein
MPAPFCSLGLLVTEDLFDQSKDRAFVGVPPGSYLKHGGLLQSIS